jgi:hypothetical protein
MSIESQFNEYCLSESENGNVKGNSQKKVVVTF